MALARNLQQRPKINKTPSKNYKKWAVYGVIGFAILAGVYGILSLVRVAPTSSEKQELKLETGDRPLPETTTIYVTADDGLFMRDSADPRAKILILVPKGTKLDATVLQDGWYKVTYMNKVGWVSKEYVTTEAPKEDETKSWKTYINKSFGYTLRHPEKWVVQDYGEDPTSSSISYVGIGPDLPASLDQANPPPIIIRVTNLSKDQAEKQYKNAPGSKKESAKVSGLSATKYTYNASSGTQMTAYIIPKSASTIIVEETGGYQADLSKIVANLNMA